MSDRTLGAIFNDCIDRLAAGETIEDCLRAYPRFATDLRPMLEAGELVNRAKIVGNEAVQAEMRVRERLLRELDHTTRDGVILPLPRRQNTPVLRLVAIWLTVFFCLISTGVGGTWVAAQLGLFDDDQEGQEEIPQTATLTLTATASPSPTHTPTATRTLSPTVTLSATPTITQMPEGDYAPSTILPQPNGGQGPNVTQGVPNNPSNGANPPQIAGTPIAPPNNPPINNSLPTRTPTRTLPVPPQGQQPPQFSPTLPQWVIHTMTAIAQTRTALPPLPNNPVNPTHLTPPPPPPNNPPINNPTQLPPPNNQPPNGQPPNMHPMVTPPAFPPPSCPPLCG